jgi:hypothetical protein
MPGDRTRLKKLALLVGKVGLSLGLLAWVLSRADLAGLWRTISGAEPGLLVLALLTPLVGYSLTSYRWRGLLAVVGSSVAWWPLWRASLLAVYFNQFMPSTIGGDAARVYEAWRAGASRSAALSSIVVDRVVGTFALVLLAVASLPLVEAEVDKPWAMYAAVGGTALGVTGLMLALFLPARRVIGLFHRLCGVLPGPLGRLGIKLERAFAPFRGRWDVLPGALGLSLLLQGNVVLMHWLIGSALGFPVPFVQYAFVVPVAFVVMLLPISINGIGVREAIFAVLLGAYGIDETRAVAFSLLSYGVFLVHAAAGGVVFAARGGRVEAVQAQPAEDVAPGAVSGAGAVGGAGA